jgi:hypothetical protein
VLDCTWSDLEAEVALRRLLLLEQKKQALAGDEIHLRQKVRESIEARLNLKHAAESADNRDKLAVSEEHS